MLGRVIFVLVKLVCVRAHVYLCVCISEHVLMCVCLVYTCVNVPIHVGGDIEARG